MTTLLAGSLTNSSLSHLDLSNNRLSKLPLEVFLSDDGASENLVGALGSSSSLSALRHLRLSGNPLRVEHLTPVVSRARHLRLLELADMGVTKVGLGCRQGVMAKNMPCNNN